MSICFIKAGVQTTLQGPPRAGHRHHGVPSSGPADPLSMSLANKLVGKPATATAIEITLTGCKLVFSETMAFALTGAETEAKLNHFTCPTHTTLIAEAGDELDIAPSVAGCRVYLALSGTLDADEFLGSASTYLPAGFGGYSGRQLKDGDDLKVRHISFPEELETPRELRPFFNNRFSLQVVDGPDRDLVMNMDDVFDDILKVTQRASRMGVQLKGRKVSVSGSDQLKSAAVFSGTIQCPPDGMPYVLLADAQTTGGYPHILQVIRSDRFQLGQLRPGDEVRFVKRSLDYANAAYRERLAIYSDWLESPMI